MKNLLSLALALLVAGSTAGMTGCSETEVGAIDRDPALSSLHSIPIETIQVKQIALQEPILATGTVQADQVTNISPIVSGLVEQVFVDVGDRVVKDQPLFKLRQTDFVLRATQLEHGLTLAKAELKNIKKDLNTKTELRRRGAVSQEVLDNIATRYEIAKAQSGIAEAQLAQAKQNLKDTTGRAPFNGVVTLRSINEGSYIRNMPGSSSIALQIQKIDEVVVVATIPEKYLQKIKLGTPATVFIDGIGKSFSSSLSIINDRVDSQTRTIEVRLAMANKDYEIKPGLFARVEIQPESRLVLVLPRKAIRGTQSPYVFVNRNGFASKLAVEIDELQDNQVEIRSGITPGSVVLAGINLDRITDGVPIKVGSSGK